MNTEAEIIIRFHQYQRYPYKLVLCSNQWNPRLYLEELNKFFMEPIDNLDTGYSVPLRRREDAFEWMKGDEFQNELLTWSSAVEGSTLDVERAHNILKKDERRR